MVRLIIFFIVLAMPALAGEEPYGLAMHDTAKYTADDMHFAYANPSAPKGGTLRLAARDAFDTLNLFSLTGVAAEGLDLSYARLTARAWDEPFTLYPLIAERLEVASDRSSLTVYINPKAQFSNGAPIVAADVVFSFETLRTHGRPNMRQVYALAQAKALDTHTVRFFLKEGYTPETVLILAMMPVLQQKWWRSRDFSAPLTEIPPTPGPYKIAAVDMGRSITYTRIKNWWGEGLLSTRGHYNFDTITYRVMRDDAAALGALAKGEIDLRREADITKWQDGHYGLAVKETFPHGRAETARGIIFNTRRPVLADVRVRKALVLLVDEAWINHTFYRGMYKRTRSIFPNTTLAASLTQNQDYEGRVALRKACALLDAAGLFVDKDGKRPLSFEILVATARDEALAFAYSRMAQKVGVHVSVRRADSAVFARRLQKYDYDAVLHGWTFSLSPGAEQSAFWSCKSAQNQGRFNYSGVCTPNIDELTSALPKVKTYKALVLAAQDLDNALAQQYFWIPLFYAGVDRIARNTLVKHSDITPLYGPVLETWWMDERGK